MLSDEEVASLDKCFPVVAQRVRGLSTVKHRVWWLHQSRRACASLPVCDVHFSDHKHPYPFHITWIFEAKYLDYESYLCFPSHRSSLVFQPVLPVFHLRFGVRSCLYVSVEAVWVRTGRDERTCRDQSRVREPEAVAAKLEERSWNMLAAAESEQKTGGLDCV